MSELLIGSDINSLICEVLYYFTTNSSTRESLKLHKLGSSVLEALKLDPLGALPVLVSQNSKSSDLVEIAEFLTRHTCTYGILFGDSENKINREKKFISAILEGNEVLKLLNDQLHLNTFCVNPSHMTISDIFAFAIVLHHLKNNYRLKEENVLRWYLHISNLQGLKDHLGTLGIHYISLPSHRPQLIEEQLSAISISQTQEETSEQEKPKNQDKKKDKQKDKKPEAVDPASRLDFRVGKIIEIFDNVESDELYNERIDIGNGEIRTIASGLKKKIPIENLRDQLVVVFCNLKERQLKGWTSQGMLMCAKNENGDIDFLRPPKGSSPGDLITIGDLPRTPDAELPKNNPFDKVKKVINTDGEGFATYNNTHRWRTDKGEVYSLVKNAIIS